MYANMCMYCTFDYYTRMCNIIYILERFGPLFLPLTNTYTQSPSPIVVPVHSPHIVAVFSTYPSISLRLCMSLSSSPRSSPNYARLAESASALALHSCESASVLTPRGYTATAVNLHLAKRTLHTLAVLFSHLRL